MPSGRVGLGNESASQRTVVLHQCGPEGLAGCVLRIETGYEIEKAAVLIVVVFGGYAVFL